MFFSSSKSPEFPKCRNPDYLVRAKDGQCYEVSISKNWGKALVRVEDPTGVEVSREETQGFKLKKDFVKIPWELWNAWTKLCFDMCEDKPEYKKKKSRYLYSKEEYEVQIVILRDEETFTKWKFLVPKQRVTTARVKADLTASVDILTGEEYDYFPLDGWVHAGSSHSHNTMGVTFSSTDDQYELIVPGLHIVIGSIDKSKNRYNLNTSIVIRKERKYIQPEEVIDFSEEPVSYHPKCLDMITKEKYTYPAYSYRTKTLPVDKKTTTFKDIGHNRKQYQEDYPLADCFLEYQDYYQEEYDPDFEEILRDLEKEEKEALRNLEFEEDEFDW